ncbi:MAG TPA: hypothetical protein VG759_23725, partial [Candidatus Angelobacter sp.]|nr:hypothetical protein [Candidatus Angelobacter sp.]
MFIRVYSWPKRVSAFDLIDRLDVVLVNGSTVERLRQGGDPIVTLYHQDNLSTPSAAEQFPSPSLRTSSSLPLRMTVTLVGCESVLAQWRIFNAASGELLKPHFLQQENLLWKDTDNRHHAVILVAKDMAVIDE